MLTPSAASSTVATLEVPSSKSISHRALIMAAFTGKTAIVRRPLRSDDVDLTFDALRTMGYDALRDGNDILFSGKRSHIAGGGGGPTKIFINHSGTSARLLTAVAAVQTFPVRIDGSARMRERPMQELITPLAALGATMTHEHGCLPITIHRGIGGSGGGSAAMPSVVVDAQKSSQFLSALLQIAPLLPNGLEIWTDGAISSKSYSDMTIAQMRLAGITVEEIADNSHGNSCGYRVGGKQHYTKRDWDVEGDYSAASYPLAAALLTGRELTITNLTRDSLQGDRVIVDILEQCGASVSWLPQGGVNIRGTQHLRGVELDMNSCPDIVPTVAVVAMFAETPSRLHNVEHLRYKESDRIAAVIGNIERLGGKARMEGVGTMVIEPVPVTGLDGVLHGGLHGGLHGASLPTFDDHRIAMAFALAALRIEGVTIENPDCVAKSYPAFWTDFDRLFR